MPKKLAWRLLQGWKKKTINTWLAFWAKLRNAEEDLDGFEGVFWSITAHTIALVLILCSIRVIHWVLNHLFEEDTKFFDFIPIRYITDFAELLAIVGYLRSVLKTFGRKK